MEHLVAEDFLEDRAGRGIAFQYIPVNGKTVSGSFFGQVKESKESVIALFVHAQVVDAVPAGRQPIGLETRARSRIEPTENLVAPLVEHQTVTVFVDGVFEIEPA